MVNTIRQDFSWEPARAWGLFCGIAYLLRGPLLVMWPRIRITLIGMRPRCPLKSRRFGPFVSALKGESTISRRKRNPPFSGERQVISFARTLYMNPQILILDEAAFSHRYRKQEESSNRLWQSCKRAGPPLPILVHYPRDAGSDLSFIPKDTLWNVVGTRNLVTGGIYAEWMYPANLVV